LFVLPFSSPLSGFIMDRREFATLAALGLVALPVSEQAEALAQEAGSLPELGEAHYQAILARCGQHLSEADRKQVRARLAGASVGRLAESLKLDWRDEPAFVYPPAVED
jgi:hypothetical protein